MKTEVDLNAIRDLVSSLEKLAGDAIESLPESADDRLQSLEDEGWRYKFEIIMNPLEVRCWLFHPAKGEPVKLFEAVNANH